MSYLNVTNYRFAELSPLLQIKNLRTLFDNPMWMAFPDYSFVKDSLVFLSGSRH